MLQRRPRHQINCKFGLYRRDLPQGSVIATVCCVRRMAMKQVGQMGETSSIPYKEITLLHKTRALFLEDLCIHVEIKN